MKALCKQSSPGRTAWLAAAALVLAAAPAVAGESEAQLIQVPNSTLAARIWNEVAPDGTSTPYYSVALDGVRFSEPRSTSYQVFAGGGYSFTTGVDGESVPAHLLAGADTNLYIVQYHTQPLDAYRNHLASLGAKVHRYVAHNAEVVEMSPAVREQVAAQAYVRWVGYFHPAYRLEPAIQEQLTAAFSDFTPARYFIMVHERGATQQLALQARIEAFGGAVHYINPSGFVMEATLLPGALVTLARADEVDYIDRWLGWGGPDMDIGRGPAGHDANYIETVGNFLGQGVRGEVFDTGLRATHVDFQNPAPILHLINSSDTFHGTMVYGQVFGSGVGNGGRGRGMLPKREQGIFAYYAQVTPWGSKPRHDHTREAVDPNGPFRAVFQTSSVGSPQVTTYNNISADTDDYLFLYDLLSCQSQSNTGNKNSRPQAWAKNIVAVGGFTHGNNTSRADDNHTGASFGPASDGRVKPDLTAYYDLIHTTSSGSDNAYTEDMNGTSGATPMTCGAFGLLFQMWHEGVWAGHGGKASVFDSRPHMATAKALMINAAFRYKCSGSDPGEPNTPNWVDLDRYKQGWGMANVRNLYDAAPWTFVVDETDLLVPLAKRTYYTRVPADRPHLKVTLAYTDPKGNPDPNPQHRINDLTLRVTAPGGVAYWGNYGLVDPLNPLNATSWSKTGGAADTKDTVENVALPTPAPGVYKTEVLGSEIVKDSHPETPNETDADFALVINGGKTYKFGDLNCDGSVDFGDINAFVLALGGENGYYAQYPDCIWNLADCNDDGTIDFGDINPFVEQLSGN